MGDEQAQGAGNLRKIPVPALPRLRDELGEAKDVADWVNQFDVYLDCVGSNQPHGLPLGDREKNILLTSHLGREGFRTFSRTPEFLQRNGVPHQQYRRQVVDFFQSAPSRAKARYDFNRRDQQHGESVREYVTALRVLAQDCNWHDEDDAIATQLICGTADKKAQLEIFAIRDQPNLEATIARPQASEAATRDTKGLG